MLLLFKRNRSWNIKRTLVEVWWYHASSGIQSQSAVGWTANCVGVSTPSEFEHHFCSWDSHNVAISPAVSVSCCRGMLAKHHAVHSNSVPYILSFLSPSRSIVQGFSTQFPTEQTGKADTVKYWSFWDQQRYESGRTEGHTVCLQHGDGWLQYISLIFH